jgi:hypothetical protein
MLDISASSSKFIGKLMVQSDYKAIEGSIAFLQQFTVGIVDANITKFFKAI